jgi:hypothetical protein
LDGLGASRAALLTEASAIARVGAAQLSFAFDQAGTEAEPPRQRLEWERCILGQPVSVHPLELAPASLTVDHTGKDAAKRLRELPRTSGREVTVAGVRLPGWTGGPGYFLGDGDCFVIVRGEGRPEPWQPVLLRGRWRKDAYGSSWFQAGELKPIPGDARR